MKHRGRKKHSSELQDGCKQSNTCVTAVPRGGGRTDKICDDIMAKKFPNLMKTIILWSQEVQKNPKHKKQEENYAKA